MRPMGTEFAHSAFRGHGRLPSTRSGMAGRLQYSTGHGRSARRQDSGGTHRAHRFSKQKAARNPSQGPVRAVYDGRRFDGPQSGPNNKGAFNSPFINQSTSVRTLKRCTQFRKGALISNIKVHSISGSACQHNGLAEQPSFFLNPSRLGLCSGDVRPPILFRCCCNCGVFSARHLATHGLVPGSDRDDIAARRLRCAELGPRFSETSRGKLVRSGLPRRAPGNAY